MAIIKEGGRTRRKDDFYPTPLPLCKAIVDQIIPEDFNPTFICDPGAGTGNWGKAIRESSKYRYAHLSGVEIQRDTNIIESLNSIYDLWFIEDYLKYVPLFGTLDLIIGNPPYKQAEEFIRHSLDLLSGNGYLIFLLRLSMLEGQKRGRGLWKETPLKGVWVSTRRIPFYGYGSDDTAYGIFVWQKDYVHEPILHWLDWKIQ